MLGSRAVAVLLGLVTVLLSSPSQASLEQYLSRPGTIRHTMSLADGVEVTLDAVWVAQVHGPYLLVRDPWARDLLPVYAGVDLDKWLTFDITGYTATISGKRVVVATSIKLYVDQKGRPLRLWIKGLSRPYQWKYMQDIPLGITADSAIPAPPEPDPDPVPTPPTPPELPDSLVSYENLIVTADRNDFTNIFYVEREDRANGIKVNYTGPTVVTRGDKVSVEGDMLLGTNKEVYIDPTSVTVTGTGTVNPIGLTNKALGGNDTPERTGVNTPAAYGLYNKGMLVRGWGHMR